MKLQTSSDYTIITAGSIIQQITGSSGGGLQRRVIEAIGTATAATSFNIEVNIPSGAKILGVNYVSILLLLQVTAV